MEDVQQLKKRIVKKHFDPKDPKTPIRSRVQLIRGAVGQGGDSADTLNVKNALQSVFEEAALSLQSIYEREKLSLDVGGAIRSLQILREAQLIAEDAVTLPHVVQDVEEELDEQAQA